MSSGGIAQGPDAAMAPGSSRGGTAGRGSLTAGTGGSSENAASDSSVSVGGGGCSCRVIAPTSARDPWGILVAFAALATSVWRSRRTQLRNLAHAFYLTR
jgi:hypothetical protein